MFSTGVSFVNCNWRWRLKSEMRDDRDDRDERWEMRRLVFSKEGKALSFGTFKVSEMKYMNII